MPHLDSVYRAALALCRRDDEAQDLAQATYTRALERFDLFRPGGSCKAWLMQIMRNIWIDRLRHRRIAGPSVELAEELVVQDDPPPAPGPQERADLLEQFGDQEVIDALNELSEEHRLTLYLLDVEQLSQDEVAAIMDVPAGTVKSRASRARQALRSRLAQYARRMGFAGRRK